ncbi:MAG: PrgI family protein, partial [Candidatus Portnoybacteria bacterium]|nr:PrgI family protein [Candidatus Portnoybacteria bacterium]
KIIGPLTLKQFLYLGGGAMAVAFLWSVLTLGAFIIVAAPVIALALALAFYKINGRPFVNFLNSFITYSVKPKLYLWKK